MRPAMKFIKHSLRGLKHLQRTAEKEGEGLQETINKVEEEVKKLKPLKFKPR